MELIDYIEIIAVILGLGLLVIWLIDYARCKLRKYGENPPDMLVEVGNMIRKYWLPISAAIGLIAIFVMLGQLMGIAFVHILYDR